MNPYHPPLPIGNRRTQPLIYDFGVIGCFIIGGAAVQHFKPYVRPLAAEVFMKVQLKLINLRTQITAVPNCLIQIAVTLKEFVICKKSVLIRWIASTIPEFFFSKTTRVYSWINRRSNLEEVPLNATDLRGRDSTCLDNTKLARVSFRYIPDVEKCELDDCNDDGLIHAYERPSLSSDTESEGCWSQADNEEVELSPVMASTLSIHPEWGGFHASTCGSRKVRTSSPVKLTFPSDQSDGAFSRISVANSEAELKVAALETQLNEMKAMIALILENQNKTLCETSKSISNQNVPQRPAGPILPPPAPPPPPPMPLTPLSSGNNQLKVKVGMNHATNVGENKPKKEQPTVPSMSDVLKGMSNVKLRPVPRSPGGTPYKCPRLSSPNDPSSMIAHALRKRFARIHSPSDCEDEEEMNKENLEDSFSGNVCFESNVIV